VTVSRPVGGVLFTGPLPGSRSVTIHLCGPPGGSLRRGTDGPPLPPVRPCSGWGLPSHPDRSGCWCALTAPFHPCLCRSPGHRRSVFCGTFLRVAPTGLSPAPCPLEPRPSSTRSRPKPIPSRGHPANSPSAPVWPSCHENGNAPSGKRPRRRLRRRRPSSPCPACSTARRSGPAFATREPRSPHGELRRRRWP
jgi:hypothetical protein